MQLDIAFRKKDSISAVRTAVRRVYPNLSTST